MALCIPRYLAEKMKKAVKEGEISLEAIYKMTSSEQRRAVWEKYVPKELAQEINSRFEKAIVSNSGKAFQNLAKEMFKSPEVTPARQKGITAKIKEIQEMGAFGENKGFYRDLVAEEMGVSVTPEEFKTITKKAKIVDKLFEEDNIIDKDGLTSVEAIKAKKELDDYIKSLSPVHNLKVATSVISKANMLTNLPPAIVNAVSNAVQGAGQFVEKRIANAIMDTMSGQGITLKGSKEMADFAKKYIARAMEITKETSYDITRLEMSDNGEMIYFSDPGMKTLGEEIVHSQGPGITRKYGRFLSKITFDYLLGFNDALSAATQYMDTAVIDSMRTAKQEGLKGKALESRALDILKDSARLQPQTISGQLVKSQSILDARVATWTNEGAFKTLSLGIRHLLNKHSGDLSAGDNLMPFVVTKANMIEFSLDAAGVGFLKAGYGLLKGARAELINGNPEPMRKAIRHFVRAGMGITLSVILANMFDPDDFVGAYEAGTQKDRDIVKLKNAPYNAFKVGGRWWSLDWLGPLGASFIGAMYARKYGDGFFSSIYQYARGATGQVLQVPGLKDAADIYESVANFTKQRGIGNKAKDLADSAVNFIRSRVIPAIVNNLLQGTDEYVRDTSSRFSRTKANIPFVRKTLPPKIDIFTGEPVSAEGFFSNLLFGSRVKTARENGVIDEITRLDIKGLAPAVSNIQDIPRVQDLKLQIGEKKFIEALKFYGKTYGQMAIKAINHPEYKNSKNDEAKQDILNKVREASVNMMLLQYGYKPKPKVKQD